MTRLRAVHVEGLFGVVDHHVTLRPDSPTILTGPNGTGKTHVLQLVEAVVECRVDNLLWLPFRQILLEFLDRKVTARRIGDLAIPHDDDRIEISVEFEERSLSATITRREVQQESDTTPRAQDRDRVLPSWIVELEDGSYFDRRQGRLASAETIARRYGVARATLPFAQTLAGREVIDALADIKCVLINTKRLDSDGSMLDEGPLGTRQRHTRGEARILQYIAAIQGQITKARNNSLHSTQSADLRFAERALAAAKLAVREQDLRRNYANVLKLYEEMARNGLAPDETPTDLPSNPNPTARRILSLLLDDWQKRLQPLVPVNRKLNELRSTVDSKFDGSGKRTFMGPQGRLEIRSITGARIPVSRLSSGEQHLLAIFSQLLFATRAGSIVLVDEPEISMHLSWQHAFLNDVAKVAKEADLQVLIATHSTGIINGRWSLVEELSLPIIEGTGVDLELEEGDLEDEVEVVDYE